MEILLVSDQLSPYTGSGPVGECVGALGRALCQLGHVVTVAMPKHEGFERHGVMVARRLTPLSIGVQETVTVHDGQLPSGVKLVLFDGVKPSSEDTKLLSEHTKLVSEQARPGASTEGLDPELVAAAATLCRAAHAFSQQRATPFDVVHAHGVVAAATLAASPLPGILTLYDPADRGELTREQLASFGLPEEKVRHFSAGATPNLLLGGMISARMVVTFSPRLAERVLDVELLGAAGAELRSAGVDVTSIAGGVDYAVFNPSTDSALHTRFDREGTQGKTGCKTAFLRELEMELDAELPLFVFAQPLTRETGADLVLSATLDLCKTPCQLIVAGQGDPDLAREFASTRLTRLHNFRYVEQPGAEAGRRLLAAADFVLCPNRDTLLGTPIRAAQRYGAVPVALATPVSADAIIDCPADLSSGTGFLFEDATSEGLRAAVGRALAAFRQPLFPRLRRRVMGLDVGWERSARRYAQMYKVITSSSHPLDH
jgi:starch synthase